ncbi:MAG: polyketide synthase dehydratase domain-containing protein, partial [Acidobacteriaceae bacterium]
GTVRFHAGLQTALATGCASFIEIGPQPHLLTLAKLSHGSADVRWLPSVRKGKNPWTDILASVQVLYQSGAEIDWKALHAKSGLPIALPTYPFERQRYWLQKTSENAIVASTLAPQGHPLLGSPVSSPLVEMQFQSRISPDHPAYLSDHVVAGRRVVPAAAYLEMALSATKGADGQTPTAKSVVLLRPCVFDEPKILQCVIENKQDGQTFAIYSRAEASAETCEEPEWVLHATGEIIANSHDAVPPANLDQIRQRCTEQSDASEFYRSFEQNNVYFGPSFRPVTQVFRAPDQALVELEFAAHIGTEAAQYQIHPAALDGCFQAVVALLSDRGAVYLPAAFESLSIPGDPRKLATAYARIRDKSQGESMTADMWGFDVAGNVLVYGSGMVMRPFKPQAAGFSLVDSISKSFYEVEWVPVSESSRPVVIAGTCIVCGDGEMVPAVAAVLEKSGVSCAVLRRDGSTAEDIDYGVRLRAINEQESAQVSDCIYIAPLATEEGFRLTSDQRMNRESESLGECLKIAQALLRTNFAKTPQLWIVTHGAQGPALSDVPLSTLWGFGRALAIEHPEMQVTRIDLDPAKSFSPEDVMRGMGSASTEDELAMRGRELYAPRLRSAAPSVAKTEPAGDSEPSNMRLELVQPGTLEGMEIVSAPRVEPGPGEIEIRVNAAGLNFRDVLNVLGMYKGNTGPLGGECAGTVERVGPGVASLQPGDEVVALGQGCFARFLTTNADMVWRKPQHLSFEAAVTIPVTFLTAWYALHSIAKIQPGECVLIHAGAGGVGLAAIQVAVQAGAVVFA